MYVIGSNRKQSEDRDEMIELREKVIQNSSRTNTNNVTSFYITQAYTHD